jgi:hypothetical protein
MFTYLMWEVVMEVEWDALLVMRLAMMWEVVMEVEWDALLVMTWEMV